MGPVRFLAVFSAVLFFSLFATNTEVLGISTYTVNTTADTAPNGCTGAAGGCTLREAIIAANTTAGPDQISFNIPGAGVREITLLSELPPVTESVVIDGLTQPLATCDPTRNLLISITGGFPNGLQLEGANSTIRGLAIAPFETPVTLGGSGGHKLECSNIGVGPAADTQLVGPGGGNAVLVLSDNNTIGGVGDSTRNIISSYGGIRATVVAGLTVRNNWLGINPISQPLADDNDFSISLTGANSNVVIDGNSFAGHRYGIAFTSNDGLDDNVSITSNSFHFSTPDAIWIEQHAGEVLTISGNTFIGSNDEFRPSISLVGDHLQTAIRGNEFFGTYIGVNLNDASGATIGGPEEGDGNTFRGASNAIAVGFFDPPQPGTISIQGNLITGEVTNAAEWHYRAGIAIFAFESVVADIAISKNTIVGQSGGGIYTTEVRGLSISNNYIGVYPDGTPGSNLYGISVASSGTDGGIAIGPNNIISANLTGGVQLVESKNVVVSSNIIGPGPSEQRYFTQSAGVSIQGGSGHLVLSNPLISGNMGPGIIAVDSTDFSFLGNGITGNSGPGVISSSQAGAVSGAVGGNQLGGNGGPGILLSGDQAVRIDVNSFDGNLGPAIDLGGDGVDVNDTLDADTGPNGRLNAPVLDWVQSAGGTLSVIGSLDTAPNTTGYIDFYQSNTCGASATGQGQYIANTEIFQTDANGHYTIQFSGNSGLTPGKYLSGVFRDGNSLGGGTSSEFSNCRLIVSDSAPTLTSLMTNSAVRGSDGFWMYVSGTNFTPGTVAYFNNSSRTTQVLDANSLLFYVDGFDLVTAGTARITVVNPAVSEPEPRGAEGSNPLLFDVTVSPRADVDCSGYVEADDALELMLFIAGEMANVCRLDADGDTITGLSDVIYIRKVAAGLLPE